MRKLIFAQLFMLGVFLQPLVVSGQSRDDESLILECAVKLSGAASLEDLDETELERFHYLAEHRVSINRASRSKLLSCGLFTCYQVAALLDYRERNGDVLSLFELSSVDGFGKDAAFAMGPFIYIESASLPKAVNKSHHVDNDFVTKGLVRFTKSDDKGYGMVVSGAAKYSLAIDDKWSVNAGVRSDPGYSASIAYVSPWRGKKVSLSKFIAGDYSLHFGQGLAMWSGFSLSGLNNVSSFSRNPGGAAPYRSYGFDEGLVHRGVACEVSLGRFALTSSYSFQSHSMLPAVNLSCYGRVHQESLTAFMQFGYDGKISDVRVASDFRVNVKGVDMFGEVATDLKKAAFICGTRLKIAERVNMAAVVRMYPNDFAGSWSGAVRSGSKCSDEHGASLALSYKAGKYSDFKPAHVLDVSFDSAWHPSNKHFQQKVYANYDWTINEAWNWSLRAQYRYRNYQQRNRGELRSDVSWKCGEWSVSGRLDGVKGDAWGGLGFVEGGYIKKAMSSIALYARFGGYCTSGWNDRIYVYERDSQGNFNVPAFYGKGWWASIYASVKVRRWLKFGIRLYADKGRKYEGKVQLSFSL